MSSLVLLCGLSLLPGAGAPRKMADPVPHAAGVCLVEVVDVIAGEAWTTERWVGDRVKLRLLCGSGIDREDSSSVVLIDNILAGEGIIREELWIGKAADYASISGESESQRPLVAGSLKEGRRYWIAIASDEDTRKYPQGVIAFWSENDPKMGKVLRAAVRTDHYKWHPQYFPKNGLTYGHLSEADKGRWRVRATKEGKVVWEKVIPCTKGQRDFTCGLWDNWDEDFPMKMPSCGRYFRAGTVQALPKDNEYALPAGTYYVSTGYEPETGRRLAAWVSHYPARIEVMHRGYDSQSGKLRYEARFDGWTTGDVLGEKLRKVARTFDPDTGRPTSVNVFRYAIEVGDWVKLKPGKPAW